MMKRIFLTLALVSLGFSAVDADEIIIEINGHRVQNGETITVSTIEQKIFDAEHPGWGWEKFHIEPADCSIKVVSDNGGTLTSRLDYVSNDVAGTMVQCCGKFFGNCYSVASTNPTSGDVSFALSAGENDLNAFLAGSKNGMQLEWQLASLPSEGWESCIHKDDSAEVTFSFKTAKASLLFNVRFVYTDDPSVPVYSGYEFGFKDRLLHRNTIREIPVILKSSKDILGFQCNIRIPEGLEFAGDETDNYGIRLNSRLSASQEVSASLREDGSLFMLAYSKENEPLKVSSSGDVELFYLPVRVLDAAPDNVAIAIENIIVSDTANNPVDLPSVSSDFVVNELTVGDIDGDSRKTVADVTSLVAIVLGKYNKSYVFEACDVNNDGELSITDVVTLVADIMSGGTDLHKASKPESFPVFVEGEHPDAEYLAIGSVEVNASKTNKIRLNVSDFSQFIAAQFDIKLPDGYSFVRKGEDGSVAATLNDAIAKNHILVSNLQPDGSCRFMIYSGSNEKFGAEGNWIAELEIIAPDKSDISEGEISNIILPDAGLKEIKQKDTAFGLLSNNTSSVSFAAEENLCVRVEGDMLHISGIGNDQSIELFGIDGSLIYRCDRAISDISLVLSKGIYIIKTKDKIMKVAI